MGTLSPLNAEVMAPNTAQTRNIIRDDPAPIWYGPNGIRAPCTDIHTKFYANAVNECEHALVCTASLTKRVRHADGIPGGRGARLSRITATVRAHKPACGLQQPRGPTRVPTCACAVCEDECAGDRTAAAGASRRGSEPMGAGRRWRAVGDALGKLKCHLLASQGPLGHWDWAGQLRREVGGWTWFEALEAH